VNFGGSSESLYEYSTPLIPPTSSSSCGESASASVSSSISVTTKFVKTQSKRSRDSLSVQMFFNGTRRASSRSVRYSCKGVVSSAKLLCLKSISTPGACIKAHPVRRSILAATKSPQAGSCRSASIGWKKERQASKKTPSTSLKRPELKSLLMTQFKLLTVSQSRLSSFLTGWVISPVC
jgi:hypothetical protein